MFNFFKKEKDFENNNISIKSLASLLIHAAKIDENYSEKEKKIIKETLTKLGENNSNVDNILKEAEIAEKDSNQILEFTKEAKNLDYKKKVIIIEALWSIIYSDKNADIYESNLMRRLSGLLYIDSKTMGDIKERIKNQNLK